MACTCGNYKRRVTNNSPTYEYSDVIVCANCGDTPPEEVQANPNQELLDFCVENIAKWDDEYTHVRSDNNYFHAPIFYSTGDWVVGDGEDGWGCGCDSSFDEISWLDFSTNTPQVISKQEWVDAKELASKEQIKLTKEDLVHKLETLGYKVTLEKKPEVQVGQVWLDANENKINVIAIIEDEVVARNYCYWIGGAILRHSVIKIDEFKDFTLLKSEV